MFMLMAEGGIGHVKAFRELLSVFCDTQCTKYLESFDLLKAIHYVDVLKVNNRVVNLVKRKDKKTRADSAVVDASTRDMTKWSQLVCKHLEFLSKAPFDGLKANRWIKLTFYIVCFLAQRPALAQDPQFRSAIEKIGVAFKEVQRVGLSNRSEAEKLLRMCHSIFMFANAFRETDWDSNGRIGEVLGSDSIHTDFTEMAKAVFAVERYVPELPSIIVSAWKFFAVRGVTQYILRKPAQNLRPLLMAVVGPWDFA